MPEGVRALKSLETSDVDNKQNPIYFFLATFSLQLCEAFIEPMSGRRPVNLLISTHFRK